MTKLAALAAILGGVLAHADVIVPVTSPAGLGSNETVTWNQLGSDGTIIPNPFTAISSTSDVISGSFAGTGGLVADVGVGWGPASGTFATNDALVWAFNNTTNSGTGPVTFTLPSAAFGVGASLQADSPGQFTAKLELFNGALSLGFVTATSDSAGDAFFLGALDTTATNVTKATFSLTAAQTNSNVNNNLGDFALDTLYIHKAAVTVVPEPASFLLIGSALMSLGWRLRSQLPR